MMPTSDPHSHLLCISSDPDIALLGQQMALTLHATPLLQVPPGQATETKLLLGMVYGFVCELAQPPLGLLAQSK